MVVKGCEPVAEAVATDTRLPIENMITTVTTAGAILKCNQVVLTILFTMLADIEIATSDMSDHC